MALQERIMATHLNLEKNEVRNAVVEVLSSAPSSPSQGQIYFDSTAKALKFYDGTAWQTASGGATPAYAQKAVSSIAGVTSSSMVMAGIGLSITPSASGKVLVIIAGTAKLTGANAAGSGGEVMIRYGTGTAPSNGAAATGTALINSDQSVYSFASGDFDPFTCVGVLSLTAGTTYWIDLEYRSDAYGDTFAIFGVEAVAFEQ